MPQNIRILAVVLHYGGETASTALHSAGSIAMTRMVEEALCAGLPATRKGEVLVLDNASFEPYPGAMRLPENIFWAGGLQKAVHLARERGFTHLWFCNNDIRFLCPPPPPALLDRVVGRLTYMQKVLGKPVGIWTPAVSSSPYHPQMIQRKNVEFSTVVCVDGIAFLLNLDCVDAVGGLDCAANMRGYGVDIWLSLRAHTAGWPLVVDHQVPVRHKYHTTAYKVDGFMDQATAAQADYLSARLGPKWPAVMQEAQAYVHEYSQ